MKTVDYTQPIVCDQNGVWLRLVDGPDKNNGYLCEPVDGAWPDGCTSHLYCRTSGEVPIFDFTVRNATPAECAAHYAKLAGGEFVPGAVAEPKPEDDPLWPVAQEAWARICQEAWARICDASGDEGWADKIRRGALTDSDRLAITELLAIIKEQRAKPDPTETGAQELLARAHEEKGELATASSIRAGNWRIAVQAMLRAMRSMA